MDYEKWVLNTRLSEGLRGEDEKERFLMSDKKLRQSKLLYFDKRLLRQIFFSGITCIIMPGMYM